jgi:hypothetical protein
LLERDKDRESTANQPEGNEKAGMYENILHVRLPRLSAESWQHVSGESWKRHGDRLEIDE